MDTLLQTDTLYGTNVGGRHRSMEIIAHPFRAPTEEIVTTGQDYDIILDDTQRHGPYKIWNVGSGKRGGYVPGQAVIVPGHFLTTPPWSLTPIHNWPVEPRHAFG